MVRPTKFMKVEIKVLGDGAVSFTESAYVIKMYRNIISPRSIQDGGSLPTINIIKDI